jgi:hypothetical protein
MTEQTEGAEVEALSEVIHRAYGCGPEITPNGPGDICPPDWEDAAAARAVLASDWLAAREAAAEARGAERALREAADRWTQGAWSDVMLPKPTPPAVPVIAYSNRVGDWLRARAAARGAEGGGEDE